MKNGELHVYDFDGTLFRSPYEPEVWSGDWWSDIRSLTEPCVPDRPGSDWWIPSTLQDAKQSISDPDTYAILMTGRPDASAFRFRIPELLKQQGLNFDAVYLTDNPSTITFKKRVIQKLLARYPFIDTVRIWDDRRSHLPEFIEAIEAMGIPRENIHTTFVRAQPKEPLCDTDFTTTPIKTHTYLGVFLDARSRAALSHMFPYKFHKAKADHMTITLKPTPEELAMVGARVKLKVIGYAENDRIQAVLVDPIGLVSRNKHPHVTLSHRDDAKPMESNQLLEHGPIEYLDGPMLSGVIDVFPRSLQRVAYTVSDFMQKTDPQVVAKAKGSKIRLSKADPSRSQWTFSATGSDKNYTVRVKAKEGKSNDVANRDLLVSCNCDYFQWQGPEHWGKTKGYLLGKPRGTASAPSEKDPKGNHLLCKHAIAALQLVKKYKL